MDTCISITNKYNIKFKITKIEYTYLNNERNTIIELCELETEHEPIRKLVKDFMDGAFMMMTKGWSLMDTTQVFKCCDCGNEVEVEVE